MAPADIAAYQRIFPRIDTWTTPPFNEPTPNPGTKDVVLQALIASVGVIIIFLLAWMGWRKVRPRRTYYESAVRLSEKDERRRRRRNKNSKWISKWKQCQRYFNPPPLPNNSKRSSRRTLATAAGSKIDRQQQQKHMDWLERSKVIEKSQCLVRTKFTKLTKPRPTPKPNPVPAPAPRSLHAQGPEQKKVGYEFAYFSQNYYNGDSEGSSSRSMAHSNNNSNGGGGGGPGNSKLRNLVEVSSTEPLLSNTTAPSSSNNNNNNKGKETRTRDNGRRKRDTAAGAAASQSSRQQHKSQQQIRKHMDRPERSQCLLTNEVHSEPGPSSSHVQGEGKQGNKRIGNEIEYSSRNNNSSSTNNGGVGSSNNLPTLLEIPSIEPLLLDPAIGTTSTAATANSSNSRNREVEEGLRTRDVNDKRKGRILSDSFGRRYW